MPVAVTAKIGVWNQTVEHQCQKLHHEHPSRFTDKYQVIEVIFSLQKTSNAQMRYIFKNSSQFPKAQVTSLN